MTSRIMVSLDGLGLCEYCGLLITMEEVGDATDAWRCPNCKKKLSGAAFGLSGDKKVRWVGPEGRWTREKPAADFNLGIWNVFVEPLVSFG
jgi:hypothetical protein